MTPENRRSNAMEQCYSVPGQTWPVELGWLYDTAARSRCHAEIGTYCGRSLLATCLGMPEGSLAVSVDSNWDGYPIGMKWLKQVRAATINRIHEQTQVSVREIDALSIDASRICFTEGLTFDTIFIDADHHFAECMSDIQAWLPMLKAGGIIAGHDYWTQNCGVMEAVNEALAGRFQVVPGTRIWYAVV